MGKRIEDLRKLDDTPIVEHQVETLGQNDARDQPWYQFVGTIDDLLTSGDYDWAFDTLTGIRETVERSRRVTEGQQRAVTNIELKKRMGRRYEGFGGRER